MQGGRIARRDVLTPPGCRMHCAPESDVRWDGFQGEAVSWNFPDRSNPFHRFGQAGHRFVGGTVSIYRPRAGSRLRVAATCERVVHPQ